MEQTPSLRWNKQCVILVPCAALWLSGCAAQEPSAVMPVNAPAEAPVATAAEDAQSAETEAAPRTDRPASLAVSPPVAPSPARSASGHRRAKSKVSRTRASSVQAVYEMPVGADREPPADRGHFEGRDSRINAFSVTERDRLATFAVDVDTAAYSIARRTLHADRMPTPSLVRVEELLNYFKYDYEPPQGSNELFAVQADGAQSPVDSSKHLLRVGIQSRVVDAEERLPANLIFLVDTSCSMTSEDKLGLAKRSLEVAVENLDERDQVAITTYAGGVRKVLGPTPGNQKNRIRRAIRGLESGGGTAMSSGMELAYKQAARMLGEGEVTRIIVLSDGDANIGATSSQDILRRVEGYVKEGVTLSTIGFGDGNYKDAMMEQLANKGNGNYYYVDSMRQAERVFGRDLTKMIQDVAQDVKIQVEFEPRVVESYRLVGYENRDVRDRDFRNDKVDAGEIGAGHQVTALFELNLREGANGRLATVRVRAKKPRGMKAREITFPVAADLVMRSFDAAPADFRFATAVMGGAELLRRSPHAEGWSFARVISLISDTRPFFDEDRAEFMSLMKKAAWLSGESQAIGRR